MGKFVLKFLIIFIITISALFFFLIEFQHQRMEEEMMRFQPSAPYGQRADMPMPPPMGEGQEPPITVPCLLIIFISTLFVYFLLRYINKNFVIPLTTIEENLKLVKKGNLNICFNTKSENINVIDTFKTLNEMVDGLKQREKLQDNFIQCLTHDLRTPLIAQERAIAILQDEYKENELISGMADNIEDYLKMVNLIMEATSEKEIKIDKIKFNLSSLVNSVISALKPMAGEKNISLNNKLDDDFSIFADYISFNRVITNLISNAVENISAGKEISVLGEKSEDKTVIIVEDTGEGIPQDIIGTLFDKYESKNKSGKKSVSGLGLYIVSELIKKNGGNIRVESELSKYTKFIIELPKDKNEEA